MVGLKKDFLDYFCKVFVNSASHMSGSDRYTVDFHKLQKHFQKKSLCSRHSSVWKKIKAVHNLVFVLYLLVGTYTYTSGPD